MGYPANMRFKAYDPVSNTFAAWEVSKQQARRVANSPTLNVQIGPWNKRNIHCYPNPNCGRTRKDPKEEK